MKALGIDASLRSTGLGIVESRGRGLSAIDYGTIKNKAKLPHSECLRRIYAGVSEFITKHHPDVVVIEGGFYFKNAKTAMILGEVRGVVIAASAGAGLPVYEYSPRHVKQALTGSGAARKDQVARMVMPILGLNEKPQEDAGDALAIAICHLNSQKGIAALRREPI